MKTITNSKKHLVGRISWGLRWLSPWPWRIEGFVRDGPHHETQHWQNVRTGEKRRVFAIVQ
jgi:hypothetical protein